MWNICYAAMLCSGEEAAGDKNILHLNDINLVSYVN